MISTMKIYDKTKESLNNMAKKHPWQQITKKEASENKTEKKINEINKKQCIMKILNSH